MTATAALTVLFAIAAAWGIAAVAVILFVAPRLARARREQTRPNLVLVGTPGALRKAGLESPSETTASQSSVVEAREALSERENAVRKYPMKRASQPGGNCRTDSDWPQGAKRMPNAPRSESAPSFRLAGMTGRELLVNHTLGGAIGDPTPPADPSVAQDGRP